MRLVRHAHREEAQQAARRPGHRQLRDREGARPAACGRQRRRRHRGRRGDRLPRARAAGCARRPRRRRGPRAGRPAHPPRRLHRADRPGGAHGHGARPAVHLLAVGLPHPRRARGRLGRAALPPCRVDQPAARCRHDGHPHLRRRARRLPVVAVRAVPRRRRRAGHDACVPAAAARIRQRARDLPRGRLRGDRLHPAGRYLEARAKARSGAALRCSPRWAPRTSPSLRDGVERRIPIEQLAVGDVFVVRPGEKIATDGVGGGGLVRRRQQPRDRRDGARRGVGSAMPWSGPP